MTPAQAWAAIAALRWKCPDDMEPRDFNFALTSGGIVFGHPVAYQGRDFTKMLLIERQVGNQKEYHVLILDQVTAIGVRSLKAKS